MLKTQPLRQSINAALGADPGPISLRRLTGGDTDNALRAEGSNDIFFVKWNERDHAARFSNEHFALTVLAKSEAPRVPRYICTGRDEQHAWLVLEYLDLSGTPASTVMGQALAKLHQTTGPAFGWEEDNALGRSPQQNGWHENWPSFWWHERMAPQLERATAAGYPVQTMATKLKSASRALLCHEPEPSLLHGDLWAGNHGYLPDQTPVIFDPASYYGDRETDLAMMHLFGGFDASVFRAYASHAPLPQGHDQRQPLYQLYHVLNHLNLFGPGWLPQASSLAEQVISRVNAA